MLIFISHGSMQIKIIIYSLSPGWLKLTKLTMPSVDKYMDQIKLSYVIIHNVICTAQT